MSTRMQELVRDAQRCRRDVEDAFKNRDVSLFNVAMCDLRHTLVEMKRIVDERPQ